MNIPQEMASLPRWVCWKMETDGKGKPRKTPYAATGGRRAAVNDPKTWGDLAQAQANAQRNRYNGVGFMLGAGIVGIDLDHCIDEAGQLSKVAKDILQRVPDTYAERSQSGSGLHILGKGDLPKGRRRGPVEVYGEGRYFIVTGDRLERAPLALADISGAIGGILADYMPAQTAPQATRQSATGDMVQRIRSSRQGAAFMRLWNAGDLTPYGGDASAADLALCNMLAFWTGKDAVQMDELFRQSALMRPKWDEKHGENTYGEMTINKAIADCRQVIGQRAPAGEGAPSAAFARYEEAYCGGYFCERGRVFQERVDRQNGTVSTVPLANFAALVTEEITRDDGVEATKEFVLEGISERGTRLPTAIVPARAFNGMGWVTDKFGLDAVMYAGQNKRDQLRDAIQQASLAGLARRTVYSHTGWREIGGRWCYLYHGGCIGADGVSVELEGSLTAYSLPPVGISPVDAAQASMDFLHCGALRVTAPLLCSMYLAPLCHFMKRAGCSPAFIPFVAGTTGTRKTTICALALSHFGRFDNKQPPASFADTANSIRRKAFLLKDAPLLVDDYHPNTDIKNRARMAETAQQLARAWGDLAERGRMQSDLTVKASQPPRGIGIMSGEDLPDIGESGLARFYLIDIHKGDIQPGRALTELQSKARDGVLWAAMRGYIGTLAAEADGLPGALRALFVQYRAEAQQRLAGAHGRIWEAVAWLMVGMDGMLAYWQECGLAVDGLRAEITAALMANAGDQQNSMNGEKPVDMFFAALRELLATGTVYLSDGMNPGVSPEALRIGYRAGDRVYLLPQVAMGEVQKLFRSQGTAFPISKNELWKRLDELGLIEVRQSSSRRDRTPVKTIGGVAQRCLCLDAAALLGEEKQCELI